MKKKKANKTSRVGVLQYNTNRKFDGYLDGNDKLSYDEELWNGPTEQRAEKNFPIILTIISQRVELFSFGYQYNSNRRAHITLPYIYQSTDIV
jgi:hypothetical protein